MMKLIVPPKEKIIMTSDEDVVPSRYYGLLSGWAYRARLQMALDLLGDRQYGKILDVGCGSGILEPSLARLGAVTAIDLHDKMEDVKKLIGSADYKKMSLFDMPWKKEFDTVLCVSVLDHLEKDELEKAIDKLLAVVKDDGCVLVGIAKPSVFVKAWFTIKRSHALEHHKTTEKDLVEVLKRKSKIIGVKSLPQVYAVYKISPL